MSVNRKKKERLGYIEGWLSIATNVLLFGLKYWAGIVSGSIAILADAWHTLSDSLSSIIVLVGVKISSKPADKEHPFGHGRAEWIASIIIAVLLSIIAFNFLVEAYHKLAEKQSADFGRIAVIVTIVSIILKEALAQFAIRTGKRINSTSLKADGWHHRSDAISSVIILIGIFLGPYFWWIDAVLGVVVAILIFYAAYEILRDAGNSLLGTKPSEKEKISIKAIANEVAGQDMRVHHIHLHRYGNHLEVTFHVFLPEEMTLKETHRLLEEIEDELLKREDMYATIHPEPAK